MTIYSDRLYPSTKREKRQSQSYIKIFLTDTLWIPRSSRGMTDKSFVLEWRIPSFRRKPESTGRFTEKFSISG